MKRMLENPVHDRARGHGRGAVVLLQIIPLDMLPETQLAFLMLGAGHVVYIPDPALPDGAHCRSVHGALPLVRVGRIGDLPFAFQARFYGTFFNM
ncbi:hypothetical protein DESC_10011 [Desulfosarcina cetonica]|nr:hypothetical protein DESC_10011 [Desulfosarcina cetonica]